MKKNKTKRIYLRLTEDESVRIRKRAEKFDSMTQFIFAAVDDFGDSTIRERMEARKTLSEYYVKADQKLAHIGGNLNQAMRQVNEAAKVANPTQAMILQRLTPEISRCLEVCTGLRRELSEITRKYAKSDYL